MVQTIFSIIISVDILSAYHPQKVEITNSEGITWHVELKNKKMVVNKIVKETFFLDTDTYFVRVEGIKRKYYGGFLFLSQDSVLRIINFIDDKNYLYSVVKEEITSSQIEALKAQAVVARTFLYKNLGRHSYADMCDLTHCQVYQGMDSIPTEVKKAVDETDGLVLLYNNEIAEVYYHSTCGGRTADPYNIWGYNSVPPYLKPVDDPYCKQSPHFIWKNSFPLDTLRKIFKKSFQEIAYKQNYDSTTIFVVIDGDTLSGWRFRQHICKIFGWNTIKSSFYSISSRNDSLIVRGKGLGHRIGVCQWGSIGMAENGFTFLEILNWFLPGTKVGVIK